MGLVIGLYLLFQHLTLLAFVMLLASQGFSLLLVLLGMDLRLLCQRCTVTPRLNLPGHSSNKQQQRYQQAGLQALQHSTSRALAQSFRRSSRPLSPPLIWRVMRLNSPRSAS